LYSPAFQHIPSARFELATAASVLAEMAGLEALGLFVVLVRVQEKDDLG
jgi:hypothetical protein